MNHPSQPYKSDNINISKNKQIYLILFEHKLSNISCYIIFLFEGLIVKKEN